MDRKPMVTETGQQREACSDDRLRPLQAYFSPCEEEPCENSGVQEYEGESGARRHIRQEDGAESGRQEGAHQEAQLQETGEEVILLCLTEVNV